MLWALGLGAALATGIWLLSPLALLYVLTDGVLAAAILGAAALGGLWLLAALWPNADETLSWHWQAILSAGLGIGVLCLALLGLGLAGQTSRGLWIVLLAGAAGAGLWRWSQLSLRRRRRDDGVSPESGGFGLLLLLLPFAVGILLVATVPPGVLWLEEARGYDVLEYHLEVPKAFYEQGRISYLPHNIYSNFPLNAEMLYLLAMILRQDPIEAALLAKLLNALLAGLLVFTAWTIGRQWHPFAGVTAALLAGSSPWLLYLSGVAYVENGMLFFGMLSAGCVCRFDQSAEPRGRSALLAGLFAGWSCGFKYTAVALIALPLLGVLLTLAFRRRAGSGAERPAVVGLLFLLGAALTFTPWLLKNTIMTGNPVFPLAYDLFGARSDVWTPPLAERWQRAHAVEPGDASWDRRLLRFGQRVWLDRRLGWWLLIPALAALCRRSRSRLDGALWGMVVFQSILWLGITHLFARFAVPLLIPLCTLGARALADASRSRRRGLLVVTTAIVLLNLSTASSLYRSELIHQGRSWQIHGHIEQFYRDCDVALNPAAYFRQRLEPGDRVLMIGEARAFYMPEQVDYCVVFNRNPFAEAVVSAAGDDDVIRWLNRRGYTHLYVNFSEMERLRRTYGFWEQLTPELFGHLERAGLRLVQRFGDPLGPVLYEVRRLNGTGDRHGTR